MMEKTIAKKCNHCSRNEILKRCVCQRVAYCNVECQRADWKNHRPECPLYVIKDSPGKGKGIFATRNLKVGSLILEEEPLMLLDGPLSLYDFEVAFQNLTDKQRKKVLSLHANVLLSSEEDKAMEIFENNSISVLGDGNRETALYYNISRINHSCSGNAIWSWKKGDITRKQVRACCDISAGEEVFVSYLNRRYYFGQRDERRSSLKQRWGFECFCKLCTLTGKDLSINEKIRGEIKVHHDLVNEFCCRNQFIKALKSACKKVELIREIREEMEVELQGALGECYEMVICLKTMGIKINPKVMVQCAVKRKEEYKAEVISIMEKLHLDCLWEHHEKKMVKITQKYGL